MEGETPVIPHNRPNGNNGSRRTNNGVFPGVYSSCSSVISQLLLVFKGATIGTLVAFVLLVWISMGSQTLGGRHQPPLPPVSTDNCTITPHNDIYGTTLPAHDRGLSDVATKPGQLFQNTSNSGQPSL